MKNVLKSLFLVVVVLLAACKDDDDKVTISTSKIKVRTLKVVTAVNNNVAVITDSGFFLEGDVVDFQYTTQTGVPGSFTAEVDEDGAWDAISKELYYLDVYPDQKEPQSFMAEFGNKTLTTDQSTKSNFHAAHHLKGDAYIQASTANIYADSLVNQHIQVIVKIVKSSNWPESAEFESVMNKGSVVIHTSAGDNVLPLYDKSQSNRAVYSAVIPVGLIPVSGEPIFTLSGLPASTYTLLAGSAAPKANQTLLITAYYDNTDLSIVTAIIKNVWDSAEGVLYGYPLVDKIQTTEDLAAFAQSVSSFADYTGKVVELTTNLDLGGEYIDPIGTFSQPFTGTFKGGNRTIRNFYVKGENAYIGLFGSIGVDGTVRDLNIEDSKAESNSNYTAILAGSNYGHIINCLVKNGSATGANHVGGIVGYNDGTIVACRQDQVDVATYRNEKAVGGGISGYNYKNIIACYSNPKDVHIATRTSVNNYGALVGENATVGNIDRCMWEHENLPGVGYSFTDVTNSNLSAMNQAITDYNSGKQQSDNRYCTFRWE